MKLRAEVYNRMDELRKQERDRELQEQEEQRKYGNAKEEKSVSSKKLPGDERRMQAELQQEKQRARDASLMEEYSKKQEELLKHPPLLIKNANLLFKNRFVLHLILVIWSCVVNIFFFRYKVFIQMPQWLDMAVEAEKEGKVVTARAVRFLSFFFFFVFVFVIRSLLFLIL
jgi:hypothetical protein